MNNTSEFPTLYKYNNSGKAQQWRIVVDGETYYTIEGLVNCKLTTTYPTTCVGKNIGKANETTPHEQAILTAKSKWQKKLDSNYNVVLTTEKANYEPMLAFDYFDFPKYQKMLFTIPTYVQPKLDGMRVVKKGKLKSRKGKPVVSCPHLEGEGPMLDGELYNHDLKADFDKIMSLTRQTKPTEKDFIQSEKYIQFWAYDFPEHEGVFSERFKALKIELSRPQYSDKFVLTPTYEITSMEELINYHEYFVHNGYEGTIIRMDLGNYANKRDKQLLKYKDFVDAEFEIVDITEGEGNRSNCAGRLFVKVSNNIICKCSMTGTTEFMTNVLRDKDIIIGKKATVKFFGYTKDGMLRFPTLKYIHDYE